MTQGLCGFKDQGSRLGVDTTQCVVLGAWEEGMHSWVTVHLRDLGFKYWVLSRLTCNSSRGTRCDIMQFRGSRA